MAAWLSFSYWAARKKVHPVPFRPSCSGARLPRLEDGHTWLRTWTGQDMVGSRDTRETGADDCDVHGSGHRIRGAEVV